LVTALLFTSITSFAKQRTTFVSTFSLEFLNEDKKMSFSNIGDREEMIQIIEDGKEFHKKYYQYALRAAIVSTAKLQSDKNLNEGFQLLDYELNIRVKEIKIIVKRLKNNEASCAFSLKYLDSNRISYYMTDCYSINGSKVASYIQADVEHKMLLDVQENEIKEAFLRLDKAVFIK